MAEKLNKRPRFVCCLIKQPYVSEENKALSAGFKAACEPFSLKVPKEPIPEKQNTKTKKESKRHKFPSQ